MNVLMLSRLFPSPERPGYGVFVRNRARRLAATGRIDLRVLAPVAWRPLGADQKVAPCEAERFTLERPRYLVIPKLGFPIAALLLYRGIARHLSGLLRAGYTFDLIDAQFFYPDGVAAILLGQRFRKPVVITARGSDLNRMADLPVVGSQIRWALSRATWTVTVSDALRRQALALGAPPDRLTVLRNGVDLKLFKPTEREETRRQLGVEQPTILAVGNLIELKGHHLLIEAMTDLPGMRLAIIGEGPNKAKLQALAEQFRVADRVTLLGSVPHDRLPAYYSAADVLVHASSMEGWPNVLLEAMACGTPVLATNVGGVPEIVQHEHAGLIIEERSPGAIAAGVRRLLARLPSRDVVRAQACQFGWDEIIDLQIGLYEKVAAMARERAS